MKDLIYEVAKERCLALSREITRLKYKDYPTHAPEIILNIVQETNNILIKSLDKKYHSKQLNYLTEEKLEIILKRQTRLIPYLYYYLYFIQGSELENTPIEIINPLRRLIKKYINNSEVIFVGKQELNFSFLEISEHFKEVFSKIQDKEIKKLLNKVFHKLPRFFLWISFPSAEINNVLLHTIIAHEFGHGICRDRKIGKKLAIEVNKEFRKKIKKLRMPAAEKKKLTPSLLQLLGNWVEEISADMIGLYSFGPAYFFAYIHFEVPIMMLDDYSVTHPAPILRLKAQSKCIENMGYIDKMSSNSVDIVSKWTSYGNKSITINNKAVALVVDVINSSLQKISIIIKNSIQDIIYSKDEYSKINYLCDRLVNIVPANEYYDKNGNYEKAKVISALNAGWEVMLSRLPELCKNLKLSNKIDDCKEMLNHLIIASVDRIEIQQKWDEN